MATHTYDYDRQPAEEVVVGLTTKSDKIRALFRAGYSRSEIARSLGIRYQHVRNVLVQSGYMETQLSRPMRDEVAAAADSAPEQVLATIGPGGRVVIPAAYRASLGVKEGDAVILRLDGEELHLVGYDTETRRIREMIARYVPEGVSLVDELIRERRREAAAEESM
ncbi:MAG: AbrB/MazE/SpoVT family DNA-binding domain-containing protein [Chloroflexi bacterium]|nr:AbrB/MazE/SpoVT family DNA-binding domain-containing protein [Chloroflexota bacterium]